MDGKSQAWRDAADKLLEALARENKYIVGDMVIVFLESAGYGLDNYMPLGGVFKRAAKRGIISKIDRHTKQALWYSKIYQKQELPNDRVEYQSEKFSDYLNGLDPAEAVHMLGITSWLYIMQPTNATDFKTTLTGFNYKGKVLGDLTVSIKLKEPKQ